MPTSGAVLGTMEGDGLAQMLKLNGGNKGTTLSGGGSGTLFMDVTLAKDATVPNGNQTPLRCRRGEDGTSTSERRPRPGA